MRFFLLIFAALSLAATPGDARIDIEAAQLEVQQNRGEARFSGGVTVRQESFSLRCATLVAHYDQGGRVNALDAQGEVRVEADGCLFYEKGQYDRSSNSPLGSLPIEQSSKCHSLVLCFDGIT